MVEEKYFSRKLKFEKFITLNMSCCDIRTNLVGKMTQINGKFNMSLSIHIYIHIYRGCSCFEVFYV